MSYDEEKVRLKPDGSEERNKQLQCVGKHTNCCNHQGQSVDTLSQLSETSKGDVLELPPEDKVEGELLYYQLQPLVTADPKKHDTLMFRKLQQVEHFPNNSAKHSHMNLFWNRKEGNERERNTNGVRRRFYPRKVIIRSQHLTLATDIDYGAGDESQLGRFSLQNQVIDDSTINLNNLTVQPPRYNSLSELKGKISYLMKIQQGCRFWKGMFIKQDGNDTEINCGMMIGYISDLLTHPFGSYLVPKQLEACNKDQKIQDVPSITKKLEAFIKIFRDSGETGAIQQVIEDVPTIENRYLQESAAARGQTLLQQLMKKTIWYLYSFSDAAVPVIMKRTGRKFREIQLNSDKKIGCGTTSKCSSRWQASTFQALRTRSF